VFLRAILKTVFLKADVPEMLLSLLLNYNV